MQPFSVDDKVLLSPWGPARRVLSYDIYVRGRAPALKGEQISEMKGPFVVLRAEMVLDMQGSLQQDKGGREEEGEIVDKEQRESGRWWELEATKVTETMRNLQRRGN